jgi:hypothetical protein
MRTRAIWVVLGTPEKEMTMASTEDQAQRQARIEADIRQLFARYRRTQQTEGSEEPDGAGSAHTRPDRRFRPHAPEDPGAEPRSRLL